MENIQVAKPKKKYAKHKLRYWFVCQSCGARKRSPRKDTKYCIDNYACRQYAYRQRKKEREAAEHEKAQAVAAESIRKMHELHEQVEQARRSREKQEAQKLAEKLAQERREAKLQDQIKRTVIEPCGCGSEYWIYHAEEKPLLGKVRPAYFECHHCEKQIAATFTPASCPKCKSRFVTVHRYGKAQCQICGAKYTAAQKG